MRAEIDSLFRDERGVSAVIGAILVLMIAAAVFGTVQVYNVPDWNKDVEYEHLDRVYDDMMTLKSDIEDVAISREPKSSNIHMGVRYPDRMFLANPGAGVAGSLTSDNMAISIVYTLDAPGDPTITQNYNSNRITYEVQGTIDSPKLVYENGLIIRDYGGESASDDEPSLIADNEIYIPVLLGSLTSLSSMETESIALKPLSQSPGSSEIKSVVITLDTLYPEVWEQLLAGKSTAATTVEVVDSQIVIHSTATRQIYLPAGDVVTDSLYAGLATFSTTIASQPASIIGGGTGMNDLSRNSIQYVPMFDTGLSDTESDVQQAMPVAGTVSNFYVNLDGSPSSGNSYTFVVRKNGADTAVTCDISGTDTTGSDLSNSVSFNVGDYISIMVTPATMPMARSMRWTAQFSPSPVSTTPPAVTTNDVTNITTTGARLNGNLTSMGTAASVSVSFQWGTSPGVYPNTTTPEVMSATGTFYFDLNGLNPGTTYYFRAQAVGDGTAYGSELNFTTSVTSLTITASAGTNGTISPSGVVIVTYGASQTFTMKPNTGYYIATLTVDGSPVTPAPRYTFTNVTTNHTISVTFAANNSVYAFQGNGQAAFWVYSISGNSWTALTSAPAAVGDGGSLVYDGANSIYAFQGNNLTGFWRYNISSNTWTMLAAAPDTVYSGGALQFDGGNYIYAFRGDNSNEFWRYDISGNSWTSLANTPNSVRYGGSLVYNGGNYMYAFRGNNSNEFWRYDISGNSWTAMTNTPNSVRYGGSLAYDGGNYIYAFRGNGTNTFWRYDISGNSWLALTSSLANVNSGGALAYPGFNYLYAFRGANTQTFWRYSISGNSWVAMTNAPANVDSGGALTSGK
jgi:outer membrane protein assembly factor BamB